MQKVRINCFSISLDGFGAGVNQDLENPLGIRGKEVHNWMFATKTFHNVIGQSGGDEGVDDRFVKESFDNVGAWILGRNMFGPIRGDWKDEAWKGWWGEEPPYHVPVFVLTHHPRKPVEMKGGTTFYFVTDGIHAALREAKKVSSGKDIRIGGGVSTLQQFLKEGYIDEMHLAFSPVLLGKGEHLFSGIDFSALGFNNIQKVNGEGATHVIFKNSLVTRVG